MFSAFVFFTNRVFWTKKWTSPPPARERLRAADDGEQRIAELEGWILGVM